MSYQEYFIKYPYCIKHPFSRYFILLLIVKSYTHLSVAGAWGNYKLHCVNINSTNRTIAHRGYFKVNLSIYSVATHEIYYSYICLIDKLVSRTKELYLI